MTPPNLTTSELAARIKQLDYELCSCIDDFAIDTNLLVLEATINLTEEKYSLEYRFAFPEE
jgi:hypothetical protein